MTFEFIPFVFGAFLVMWIDIFWWKIDYKKAEKGLEWHEHYHVGLELIIIGIFTSIYHDAFSSFLYGAGFLFMAAEWRQAIEIKGKKVIPGHPFAYESSHFKSSTVIGIVLTAFLIISYVYLLNFIQSI